MRLQRALWVAAPLLVGALALSAGWSGPAAPLLLIAAAVLPLAVIGALTRLGIPAWIAAVTPTVVGGGVAMALAANGSGVAIWHEIGRSVRTLLAVPSPAHVTAVLLLPGVLLCLVAGSIAGVRLHLARGGWVAGVAGGVVLYAGGQLLSAGTADASGLLAALLLATALLGWQFGGDEPARAGLRVGRLALIALVALPPVLVGVVGSGAGYQPRDHVSQPRTILKATDPLASLALWTSHPDVALFQATVSGTDRLHVATLDSYNGQAWQDAGSFVPLDQYASPDLPVGAHRQPVSATIRLGQIGGPLLPTVSSATTISDSAGLIDPSSGDTALVDGVAPGVTYSVSGTKPDPAPASLASAVEPIVPAGYLDVPAPPAGLLEFARNATANATTPLQQAVALEAAVAAGRTLKVDDPGGSGYSRLLTFLFRPASENGHIGNSEQFAAAFAVLGRLIGLPTRVVVGFHLPSATIHQQTITGADARAWPEVYLGGVGWLPFDPTPGAASSADAAVRAQVLAAVNKPGPTLPLTPPSSAKTPPAAPAAPPAPVASHRVRDGSVAAAVILLLALAGLIGRRAAKRRRRRLAGATGAWADVLDLRARTKLPISPGLSGTAIASSFAAFTPRAGELATVIVTAADGAAFAPTQTGGSRGSGHAEAAWAAVGELRREVRRNRRALSR